MSIVARQWMEVPTCPYCGAAPEVVTQLDTTNGDVHHEVTCATCGLSAPLTVWQVIGEL